MNVCFLFGLYMNVYDVVLSCLETRFDKLSVHSKKFKSGRCFSAQCLFSPFVLVAVFFLEMAKRCLAAQTLPTLLIRVYILVLISIHKNLGVRIILRLNMNVYDVVLSCLETRFDKLSVHSKKFKSGRCFSAQCLFSPSVLVAVFF